VEGLCEAVGGARRLGRGRWGLTFVRVGVEWGGRWRVRRAIGTRGRGG